MNDSYNTGNDTRLLAMICRLNRLRKQSYLDKFGLHLGQDLILFVLWEEEGIKQSDLAKKLYIKPPTLARALNHMEQNGFIRRETDIDDKRMERVYLTDKGWTIRENIFEMWEKDETQLFAGFEPQERQSFQELMERLYLNLFAYAAKGDTEL